MKQLNKISDELMIMLIEGDFDEFISKNYYINTEGTLMGVHPFPFQYQVRDHLRDNYKLLVLVPMNNSCDGFNYAIDLYRENPPRLQLDVSVSLCYETHEEALEMGLIQACKLIKEWERFINEA